MNKKIIFAIFFSCLMNPYLALAGVDLPWSTTYNCDDWNQYSDPLSCNELSKGGSWTDSEGNYEQITSAANNPAGDGSKGQRHWIGPGTNNNSGGMEVKFNNNQTNFWMRWYMRWESGFRSFSQYKALYIYPTSGTGAVFQPGYPGLGGIRLWSSQEEYTRSDCAYGAAFYMGGISDGTWQLFEMHLNTSTGVFQAWVNENLVIDRNDVDYGSINSVYKVAIGSNCKNVNNSGSMYIDYDDIAISNTGYIGPLSGAGGGIAPPNALCLEIK